MNKLMKIILLLVLAAFCSLVSAQEPDYADTGSWAYWRVGESKPADLFIVCPTVDLGTGGNKNMSLTDENIKGNFTGALNMQRGIYEKTAVCMRRITARQCWQITICLQTRQSLILTLPIKMYAQPLYIICSTKTTAGRLCLQGFRRGRKCACGF